ncbi:MAG: serine hydrolase [Candidatus Saccharibacteria bacterium]|nr:serine hydrolase [Candidatus Saccharibacteria bacterium]
MDGRKKLGFFMTALAFIATLTACSSNTITPATAKTLSAPGDIVPTEIVTQALGAPATCDPNDSSQYHMKPYQEVLTPFAKIDQIISNDIENGFPGAQLCVMDRTGNILYSNAWGNIQTYNRYGVPIPKEDRIPVTTATLFDIGGTSEIFTAWYATLHLISTGELSLDTRVADILGKGYIENQDLNLHRKLVENNPSDNPYEVENSLKYWRSSLTVEDLLRNRTGNPAGPDFHKQFLDEMINPCYNSGGTRGESLALLDRLPLIKEPRTAQAPSDVDAITLTFIVEKVTGKRFDVYLNELWTEINNRPATCGITATFNPLAHGFAYSDIAATEISGNTRFGLISFPRVRTDVVHGEVHDEAAYYTMEGISGNAGLFSNAESLCRLLLTYLGPEYGMFSANILERMVTPTTLINQSEPTNIGMAWYLEFDENNELCEYWMNSFTRCYVGVLPQSGVVIAYLTNTIHSPARFTTYYFSEHDLNHIIFAGSEYQSSKQSMLFQPE